ncbi:MAG: NADH-quinone oxidoreductase subunit J [Candidatus Tokpelaia sp. JSC085]|nr:MAG: NADH-quinone oxidoreductase subunit J [Candidatus Tokpelaia sp. JSC085]
MLSGLAAVFFYLFSFVMIVSATTVVVTRNTFHSVLFLILSFFNAAALFLLAGAEFLAIVLLVIYVGAVAVLFLFVIMMLDVDLITLRRYRMPRYAPVGILAGIVLLMELIVVFISSNVVQMANNLAYPTPDIAMRSNTQALGDILYTDYVFYFEIAGLVLLVAMIGAITLTLRHKTGVRRQSIAEQVARMPKTSIEIRKIESNKGL